MKRRVLFVDDEPSILRSFRRTLRSWEHLWEMRLESSPLQALAFALAEPVDVIVTDVRMPEISGLELLRRLQAQPATREIPVIIVTGEAERGLKREAIDLGATDLLSKPVDSDDLIARIRSALRLKDYQDQLRACNEQLEHKVRERTRELLNSRMDIVWRLSKAAEYRDEETGNHVLRVGCYARAVGRSMGLDNNFVDDLFLAAPLHDIGKIGIPDRVLRKPGRLNSEEWGLMRRHCDIGASILQDDTRMSTLWRNLGGDVTTVTVSALANLTNPIVDFATSIARAHHERWDGTGYPLGLAREEIPMEARIVAICDVFDALRSHRPYKEAYPLDRTMAILLEGRGSHFDPEIHDALLLSLDQILDTERMLSDTSPPDGEGQPHETCLVC